MNRLQISNPLRLVIESFLSTWALAKVGRLEAGNIFVLFLFIMCLVFFHTLHLIMDKLRDISTLFPLSTSKRLVLLALSFLFTVFYMIVSYQEFVASLSNKLFQTIILSMTFIGMWIFLYNIILFLCSYTTKLTLFDTLTKEPQNAPKWLCFYRKHIALLTLLICLLCWLPMFLYLYPGILTPDSINQMEQVLGIKGYSNHHPWIHTLFIKLCYSIGSIFTDNLTIAVSFYTVGQMILLACAIAYFLTTLKYIGVNTWICLIITAFYALVPYNAVFAVTMWKDVLFAAIILVFTCSLYRISKEYTRLHLSIYFFSCILFCLFRSNGWYAFLLCVPFLILHFRSNWKRYVPLHIAAIVIVLIIKIPVMNAFEVRQPDFVESLCIPLQQIANVLIHDRELTSSQADYLDQIMDRSLVKELYVPTFADNIKELVRAGNPTYLEANKGAFFKLWFQLLCKYPGDYIDAYVKQTYGYFYPDVFYVIADNEGISPCDLDIVHTPLIGGPLVIKIKEISLKLGYMIPLYGLIWCIGAMGWVLLFCIANSFLRDEYKNIIYYLPSLALVLTVMIATPVASDFRYVYFLFLCMPFYIILTLKNIE